MEQPQGQSQADDTPEATSDKTLSDIEETKKPAEQHHESSTPSPDGQFDEPAEKEKAGPM